MGFVCPVCSALHVDGEHLADHLAFVALLHGDDHEAWLAEHVPDWAERDTEGLASSVTELVDESDHDVVGMESTDEASGAATDGASTGSTDGTNVDATDGMDPLDEHVREPGVPPRSADLDPEARRILDRARELTRRMHETDETEQ